MLKSKEHLSSRVELKKPIHLEPRTGRQGFIRDEVGETGVLKMSGILVEREGFKFSGPADQKTCGRVCRMLKVLDEWNAEKSITAWFRQHCGHRINPYGRKPRGF